MRINCKNWTPVWFEFWLHREHRMDIPYDRLGKYKLCTPLKNWYVHVKLYAWPKARGSAEVQGSLTGGVFYHFVKETEKHLISKYCVNHKEWGVSFFPALTSHTCMCLELPGGILKLLSACWRWKGTFTNMYCSSHSQANKWGWGDRHLLFRLSV